VNHADDTSDTDGTKVQKELPLPTAAQSSGIESGTEKIMLHIQQYWYYRVVMNRYDQAAFIAFIVVGLHTMGLLYFMILRVNRNLPQSRWIPLNFSLGRWKRLTAEYKGFYPRSVLPHLMESGGYLMLIIAVSTLVLRWWEYAKGIP
jgi:hypothetical protein